MNYDYDDPDGRPGTGATALATAIIRAGLVDLADHREPVRTGARDFFKSAWFSMLAEGCQLDPVAVRDLTFTGELMAEVATSPNSGFSSYSGSAGRWTELRLYRTKAGKLVAERISRTQWQGESDGHEAAVCDNEAAAVEFFGHDSLAKELYASAGIDAAESVE